MPLPDKQYTRLEALLGQWKLSKDDVFYAVENGLLNCCISLQPRYVERGSEEQGFFRARTCECCDGLVLVRSEDCQTIFQNGEVQAHSFISLQTSGDILRITHEPPQPFIGIRLQHLLVMREEQQRFENTYSIRYRQQKQRKQKYRKYEHHHQPNIKVYNNYKEVDFYGVIYHFGMVQADITKQLHYASKGSDPWVHGKILLSNSGSHAMRFQDVFKNKKGWREIIESDGRGYYRLNLKTKQFHQPLDDSAAGRK